MTLFEQQEAERQKYEAVYRQPNYRMGADRLGFAQELLLNANLDSYLDVSCGRGEMLDYAKTIGIEKVQGTEVVSYLTKRPDVIKANAWDIDLPDSSFQGVSLFDVIEHLLPEDTEKTLIELKRLASHVIFFTAANYSASGGGVELHVNRKPYLEWHDILKSVYSDCKVFWLERKYNVRNETWAIYLPK